MTPKTLPQQQPSVRTYLTRSRKASLPSQAAAAAGLGKHDSQATSESPLPRRNLRKRPYGDLATPTKLVDDSLSASPAPKESRVLKRRKLKIKDDVEDGSSEFAEDQIRGKELEAPREPPVRSSIVPAAPALSEVSEAPPVPLDIIQRQTRIAQDPTKPVPQSRLPPDSPVLSTFDGPPSVAEPSAEPSVKPVERALRNVKASDAADRAKAPTETELESPDAGSIHDHISILEEKRLAYLDRRLSLDKSLSRQAAAPTLFRTVAPTHLSASASSLYTQIGQVDSKLSLPPKYEGLEQQFCELERALALFKARDKAANFEDLKVTIRLASRSYVSHRKYF
ncbi:uncharacterized protein BJ171DRAFT_181272 [Polychytrium aggregatum]|uniref:uncharacterized protein n=1 Tax=Polychytrium aggregatum TaxID=110093 RepID=UPI0022FE1E62|nr:uncharacterized protein BJ171DRAFT_181272 [Polychytrium aggregatum]KAI9202497.1 hypothetical protein BJ171DRAFT_181272 [Polychytrium aggregatum]